MFKHNITQSTPNNYTRTTVTFVTTPVTTSATSGTPATLSSSSTTVNFSIMHLFQHILQILPFLSPFRHQTTSHHIIDVVSDAAHPSTKL
jgi:hypothetical protein